MKGDVERVRSAVRAARREQLATYERLGLWDRVRIFTMLDSRTCSACVRNDGRVMTLDDAIRAQPLPCRRCACSRINRDPRYVRRAACQCLYMGLFPSEPADREDEADRRRLRDYILASRTRRTRSRAETTAEP